MFRKKKEDIHLIENLNAKVKNRDEKIDSLKAEIIKQREEKRELRFELEEKTETLRKIEQILSGNLYNNEKIIIRKAKELAQSSRKS